MSRRENRPSHIKLDAPTFPYAITDETTENPGSIIEIKHADSFRKGEKTLFYIAGGSLQSKDNGRGMGTPEFSIQIRHPFARDEENDGAYVADFKVKSLQMVTAYDDNLVYTGWLTSAQFYPSDYVDERFENFNPFVGAVKKDTEEDYYANSGYPYQAPSVLFGDALTLPLEVEITLSYNQTDTLNRLNEYMDYHEKERIKREEKVEADRIALEKRREEQRIAQEAYLLTDEGKAYTLERALIKELRTVPKGKEFPEGETNLTLVAKLAVFTDSLTDEEKAVHARSKEDRTFGIAEEDTLRQEYLKAFDRFIAKAVK